ncbi:hypothetical protein HK101_003473 [Irineochytrium annulatum]|nr:hypothetical protein HK101_003473 [Irineochytrium annulatum]
MNQEGDEDCVEGPAVPVEGGEEIAVADGGPVRSVVEDAVEVGHVAVQGPPIPRGRSRQMTALAMKTVHYQKRQICCIGLCPLLMVIVSNLIGVLVAGLLANSFTYRRFLYCSNASALDPTNDIPYYNINPDLPVGKGPNGDGDVTMVDFDAGYTPCVYWFGVEYPATNATPYEKRRDLKEGVANKDSTFLPQPRNGWINPTNDLNVTASLISNQQKPWSLVGAEPGVNLTLLGARPAWTLTPLDALATPLGAPNYTAITDIPDSKGAYGLLGEAESRYFVNLSGLNFGQGDGDMSSVDFELELVPYYELMPPNSTLSDLTTSVAARLQSVIALLARINSTVFETFNPSLTDLASFELAVQSAASIVPPTAIYFHVLDHHQLAYNYTLVAGRDYRLEYAPGYPSAGMRMLVSGSVMANQILRSGGRGKSRGLGNARITQGNMSCAHPHIRLIIFAMRAVKEKEDRIMIMMRMNGLSSITYYATHYVHFYFLHAVSSTIFLIAGYLAGMQLFTLTDFRVLVVVWVLWGNAQIATAFLFSTFFDKARMALIITFLMTLTGVIVALAIDYIFISSAPPPLYYIWPPFAFYRCLSVINAASLGGIVQVFFGASGDGILPNPYRLSFLANPNDQVTVAVYFLIGESVAYLLLAVYLSLILPSEFGVRRPWHFPVSDVVKMLAARGGRKRNGGGGDVEAPSVADGDLAEQIADLDDKGKEAVTADGDNLSATVQTYEDADVISERHRVLSNLHPPSAPLIMKHMKKRYNSGPHAKWAVKDVTLAVETGVVLGLLGPNGAGKTTLISILTGLHAPTSGTASIAGHDLATDMRGVYDEIGICPQHDILWDDLTVREHLLFYARLKGVRRRAEAGVVRRSLEHVNLVEFEHRLAKGLSGGEKRRVSIAIALIGFPKVVFLDEPTTGLDPEVRRVIWNIVERSREGKTIVLTTHSMEEAEVLCQRIAIMSKGHLRCVGPQYRLKELYGAGIRLTLSIHPPDEEERRDATDLRMKKACDGVQGLLAGRKWRRIDSFATSATLEFQPAVGDVAMIFEAMESRKVEFGIMDWGISQTTLEEVFVSIISDADASSD